jgi:hypothetical protein
MRKKGRTAQRFAGETSSLYKNNDFTQGLGSQLFRRVPTCHRRFFSDGLHGDRAGNYGDAPQAVKIAIAPTMGMPGTRAQEIDWFSEHVLLDQIPAGTETLGIQARSDTWSQIPWHETTAGTTANSLLHVGRGLALKCTLSVRPRF